MDAGLQIKEFAEIIGVTQDTVINRELWGMRPLRKDVSPHILCPLEIKLFILFLITPPLLGK